MFNRISHLRYFFSDTDKKPFFKIIKEMIIFGWIKKELPTDYFRKFLYRKDIKNYKSYLSLGEFYKIIDSPKILNPDIAAILDNKLSFAYFAKEQGIPSPKLLGFGIKNIFFSNQKHYIINSKSELIEFFKAVFNENKMDSIFIKPISGVGGEGCMLINKANLDKKIGQKGEVILNNNYLFQEKIIQHPTIDKIHSNSINTIRVNTYLDQSGKPHFISALMRFGQGDLITDNESSGGLYMAVDIENETLKGVGIQSIVKGGKVHTHHPDSNTYLDGFKLPYIKETIALVKSVAVKTPTRIIGWDVALTVDGPLIIEGNSNPSLSMGDVAYGGYGEHPIIKQLLNEVKS